MDREVNIDSIRALEEQIGELERATIKLKRTRNSLLNVSKLPPEVLGKVFHWNVDLKDDFGGLDKRSHNFLLVCHHWSEVASHTPELWSFWGNTPEDWARWCHRSETAPLDLVLGGDFEDESRFTATLRNVLRDRATRDTIRRVHLGAKKSKLLRSIIAQLAPNHDEELRSNGIESLILRNQSRTPVDVSDLFAHYRFPKLRYIELINCTISSWDHLTSRTSVLTTLVLGFHHPSLTPTTFQLLSILTSCPILQKVVLIGLALPGEPNDKTSIRVQLHHLKELRLWGGLRSIIGLLHQLDHPRNMDHLGLTLNDCDMVDASQIIGTYLRDHLRCRDRPQSGLGLVIYNTQRAYEVTLHAGDAGGIGFSPSARIGAGTFATITVQSNVPMDALQRAALDLIAYTPREEVVYIQAYNVHSPVTNDTYAQFPNLRALLFNTVSLSAAFPNSILVGDEKVLPSLERVSLERVVAGDSVCDSVWGPLVTFLADRVSSGNRLGTLGITNSIHICRELMEEIRGMVRELKVGNVDLLDPFCPVGTCPGS